MEIGRVPFGDSRASRFAGVLMRRADKVGLLREHDERMESADVLDLVGLMVAGGPVPAAARSGAMAVITRTATKVGQVEGRPSRSGASPPTAPSARIPEV
jgi:hypothetical protein